MYRYIRLCARVRAGVQTLPNGQPAAGAAGKFAGSYFSVRLFFQSLISCKRALQRASNPSSVGR